MAKYKTIAKQVDAIQFTGSNGADIQAIAGTHAIDESGHYQLPNFDYADYWFPDRLDDKVVAVLWSAGQWVGVKVNDVLVRDDQGVLNAYSVEEFTSKFEAV